MSEEKIIKIIKEKIILDFNCYNPIDKIELEAIQGLLDLYNKEKEKNKLLIEGKFREVADKNSYIKDRYISKDEVLKAIGYEENYEEYDRLKQDDEKLLAILDILYSEVCRLEDIEDKKVEVAVSFIEEKRDKYWQDKIKNKIKELEDIDKYEPNGWESEIDYAKGKLKELL